MWVKISSEEYYYIYDGIRLNPNLKCINVGDHPDLFEVEFHLNDKPILSKAEQDNYDESDYYLPTITYYKWED